MGERGAKGCDGARTRRGAEDKRERKQTNKQKKEDRSESTADKGIGAARSTPVNGASQTRYVRHTNTCVHEHTPDNDEED